MKVVLSQNVQAICEKGNNEKSTNNNSYIGRISNAV